MDMNSYFARINSSDSSEFEGLLSNDDIEFYLVSYDFDTALYSLDMDERQELNLKLSFPIKGFMKNG
jgi:hypothetical protein